MLTHDILTADALSGFKDYKNHQKIVQFRDDATGLNAFIAVHNSKLGPALGGCRLFPYASEAAALTDALRLSRGMTYKNALAGLPLGGGKSVIIGDPFTQKTDALMQSFGQAVEILNGLYITAEDSGTGEKDMLTIGTQTRHVVGLPPEGSDLGGNPSPVTAWGVYHGIKAAVARRYKTADMNGMTASVQGLGSVGYELCRLLAADGVKLYVTDIRADVTARARDEIAGVTVVDGPDIFAVDAHLFAPCALGAQLNDDTIPLLNVDIVAGAANNQLATAQSGPMLADRDILYVPDYVINAGGVIAVAYEFFESVGKNPFNVTLNRKNMLAHVERIGQTITRICNLADARGLTPATAADQMAESIFLGTGNDGFTQPRTATGG